MKSNYLKPILRMQIICTEFSIAAESTELKTGNSDGLIELLDWEEGLDIDGDLKW